MSKAIGIDLGTTNSVAAIKRLETDILPNAGSCTRSLRLIPQPDKPGKMLSLQHVYEGVLPWSRICFSTSSC